MEASEEEKRHPAPSGGEERGTGRIVVGIPRESLGWTLWDVGHIREAKGEVMVAGTIPRHASVHDDLRKLSGALHSPTSGQASPDLPFDCPLQVDGRSSDDVDGGRADAVSGVGSGGPHEPGGGLSVAEQNDRGRVPISDRRSGMPVWVCR